ncbi:hypothetical protein Btru_023226 [Bulinus truncatus]|nr:hypothetical protein Btru_023226 [Bulinus truncatus]
MCLSLYGLNSCRKSVYGLNSCRKSVYGLNSCRKSVYGLNSCRKSVYGLNSCLGSLAGSLHDITKEELIGYFPYMEKGGRLRPSECVPRERLAIIIPYRNRYPHLHIALHNLIPLLKRQQADVTFFVIEQALPSTFNRGALLNIGFLEAEKRGNFHCYIFHDVDLIPLSDRNLYRCGSKPRHYAVAINKYKYKAVSMHKEAMSKSTCPWSDITWSDIAWSDIAWSDIAWSDIAWSDIAWFDIPWSDITSSDIAWSDIAWSDIAWSDIAWSDITWSDITWFDIAWSDIAWFDIAWSDIAWSDITWSAITWSDITWSDITWSDIAWSDIAWFDIAWLPYPTYFGGVVGFSREQYLKVNGNSNLYIGWGGEDDDLLKRLKMKRYVPDRYPVNVSRYHMIKHTRDKGNEANPLRKAILKSALHRQDVEGLNTVKYKVLNVTLDHLYTWITVSVNTTEILMTAPWKTLKDVEEARKTWQREKIMKEKKAAEIKRRKNMPYYSNMTNISTNGSTVTILNSTASKPPDKAQAPSSSVSTDLHITATNHSKSKGDNTATGDR